ncbi:MAG: hypothetical protein M3389_06640 [Actinomycetota bacterium]|nr:hypothetical protein [Actinomycetota bacterium]
MAAPEAAERTDVPPSLIDVLIHVTEVVVLLAFGEELAVARNLVLRHGTARPLLLIDDLGVPAIIRVLKPGTLLDVS